MHGLLSCLWPVFGDHVTDDIFFVAFSVVVISDTIRTTRTIIILILHLPACVCVCVRDGRSPEAMRPRRKMLPFSAMLHLDVTKVNVAC